MELVLIKTESKEWEFMWNWLESHPINEDLEQPCVARHEDESWQYMGSFKEGERVIHNFRHRNHPKTKTRLDLSLQASEALTEDQIEKTFRL